MAASTEFQNVKCCPSCYLASLRAHTLPGKKEETELNIESPAPTKYQTSAHLFARTTKQEGNCEIGPSHATLIPWGKKNEWKACNESDTHTKKKKIQRKKKRTIALNFCEDEGKLIRGSLDSGSTAIGHMFIAPTTWEEVKTTKCGKSQPSA